MLLLARELFFFPPKIAGSVPPGAESLTQLPRSLVCVLLDEGCQLPFVIGFWGHRKGHADILIAGKLQGTVAVAVKQQGVGTCIQQDLSYLQIAVPAQKYRTVQYSTTQVIGEKGQARPGLGTWPASLGLMRACT